MLWTQQKILGHQRELLLTLISAKRSLFLKQVTHQNRTCELSVLGKRLIKSLNCKAPKKRTHLAQLPHFTDEETKARKGAYSQSASLWELLSEPKTSDAQPYAVCSTPHNMLEKLALW